MGSEARGGANPSASRPTADGEPPRTGARRGRRIAGILFYAAIGLFVVAVTYQLTRQVFFAEGQKSPFTSCGESFDALTAAIARAREAAPGLDGEDAAVARFRAALAPEWDYRADIGAKCRGEEATRAALDAIDRLRYAEENAARREAHELAPLRRRVDGAPHTAHPAPTERPAPPGPAP